MEDIEYHIPVWPHVKKFLAAHGSVEPFRVSTHNQYGTLLYMCLETKERQQPEKMLNLGARMLVRIPKWNWNLQGFYLSNKKVMLFNEMVQRLMLHQLNLELHTGCRQKGDIKKLIENFRTRYDIWEDEMTYENMRKNFFRYRQATGSEQRLRKSA